MSVPRRNADTPDDVRTSTPRMSNIGKKRVACAVISIVLMFCGLLHYLLLNQQAHVSRFLLKYVQVKRIANENLVIRILRCYGADFLWSASFTMIIQSIVWLDRKRSLFLIFCSTLGIVYEGMQYFGLTSGTADITDVAIYILGCIAAITIIQGGKLYETNSNSGSCIGI